MPDLPFSQIKFIIRGQTPFNCSQTLPSNGWKKYLRGEQLSDTRSLLEVLLPYLCHSDERHPNSHELERGFLSLLLFCWGWQWWRRWSVKHWEGLRFTRQILGGTEMLSILMKTDLTVNQVTPVCSLLTSNSGRCGLLWHKRKEKKKRRLNMYSTTNTRPQQQLG